MEFTYSILTKDNGAERALMYFSKTIALRNGTEKGFDFLGYHFGPEGLSVAGKTIKKFFARAVRLYEQEQREPSGSPLLGLYVER